MPYEPLIKGEPDWHTKINENFESIQEDSVYKSQVVNNFTTTEAGFVADARAVQVLNDKLETIKTGDVTLISEFPDTISVIAKRLTYISNIATIRVDISNFSVSIGTGGTFATITKKPRIGQVVFMVGTKDGQEVAGSAYINTNGEILSNFVAGTWTRISMFGAFLL